MMLISINIRLTLKSTLKPVETDQVGQTEKDQYNLANGNPLLKTQYFLAKNANAKSTEIIIN